MQDSHAADVQAELQQYLNSKNINSLFISIVEVRRNSNHSVHVLFSWRVLDAICSRHIGAGSVFAPVKNLS
jgi:hypothetical protein